jgi:aspartokinase
MLTISSAVQQVVAASDFAIEGLQSGCLNMTAYAVQVCADVAKLTKKPVQKTSVVMALTRLAKKYRDQLPETQDFKLFNLVSRSGLTELTYPKTPQLQRDVTKLFERADIQSAPFCVATVGLGEISIVTDNSLGRSIQNELSTHAPSLNLSGLSSLTMQVGIETIDTPRQSYTVIKQLALRNITIVEYITSPTELTIILYDRDLKESFVILHDRFFGQTS